MKRLTHVGPRGEARMIDVGGKPVTKRVAVASARLETSREVIRLIRQNALAKGDVLAVARLAGIMAAKRASELIPLCHPLALDVVEVTAKLEAAALVVRASATTTAKTGVEMEALTAAAVAALAAYDMCKAVDKGMRITELRLEAKSGGRSGRWTRAAPRGRALARARASAGSARQGGSRKGATAEPRHLTRRAERSSAGARAHRLLRPAGLLGLLQLHLHERQGLVLLR
jgi:cyclic pyranopterin phosphate synthase